MGNYFAEKGWDVTVFTFQEEFFDRITASRDDSLLDAIHPNITVVRPTLPLSHLERDIRLFDSFRGNFPRLHREVFTRASVFDRYTPWLPNLLKAALSRHRANPADLVIATGNPWTTFAAAAAFNRLTRVPYVIDYRDSWTLNQFTQQPAFPEGDRAYTWEPRLLKNAARIVFVNSGMLQWHAERYPHLRDRMMILENGYDADLLEDMYRPADPGQPLRFGYLGTMTDQYDNSAFWRGWQLAQAEPELAGATANIYGYVGFFGAAAASQAKGLPDSSVTHAMYHGPVAKREVAATYKALDVMLFLVPNSKYVTSGKTYEYMATGKPIVAVHSPDSAAGDALKGYPLRATVADITPRDVRDALIEGARMARRATRTDYEACIAYARGYDRKALLAPFEAEMRTIVS